MNFLITLLGQTAAPPPTPSNGSSMYLIWGLVLIAMALVLFIIELFLPTAGIIIIFSIACLIAGIAFLFGFSTTAGIIGAILTLFTIPFLIALGIRVWPHTFIAKWLTIGDETNRPDDDETLHEQPEHKPLSLGTKGTTLTPLRPVGTCEFQHQREECIAESGVIEKGQVVEITLIDGMQVKVKPVE